MVHRVSQFFIAMEGVDQEDGASLVQRASHPDGQVDADQDVSQVRRDDDVVGSVHRPLSHILNVFKIIVCSMPEHVKGKLEHVQLYELSETWQAYVLERLP